MTEGRDGRLDLLDIAKIDIPLGQFPDDDFAQTAQTRCIFSGERNFVLLRQNFDDGILKIEARGQLFARLIDGVIYFLFVHVGNDVE